MSEQHKLDYAASAKKPVSKLNVGLWILQILLAMAFLFAAGFKLMGALPMVRQFDTLGLGQWFRYFTGIVEATGAILLLWPRRCGLGALLLVCTMIGAIIAHETRLGGNPTAAILFLVLSAIVLFGRVKRIL